MVMYKVKLTNEAKTCLNEIHNWLKETDIHSKVDPQKIESQFEE